MFSRFPGKVATLKVVLKDFVRKEFLIGLNFADMTTS